MRHSHLTSAITRATRHLVTPIAAAAFLAALSLGTAEAQTAAPASTEAAATLSTVTVNASADASAEGLTQPFAGGQVARGGRVGILGNQDNMATPFAVTAYTNELIQNQQARSVGDVLQNDPSVRVARGFGNFQESYFVRGFLLSSDNMAYNGLYSLLPRQYISSELFERVEVLHGASNFLTGITPSGDGIGGTINLLPKRAPNEPLNQATLGTASGSQFYVAADLARRFGPDQSTGIRINAAHRNGGTGVDYERVDLDVVSVGLDWRSSRARLSADVGYQNHELTTTRTNVTVPGSGLNSVSPAREVMAAPDASSNWAQPWSFSNEKDTFGTVRGEYDLTDGVTGWFAAGARTGKEANALANLTVTNATTGAATTYRFDNTGEETVRTGEFGLRGKAVTGPVTHALVASYSFFGYERKNAYRFDPSNTQATNLYTPRYTALPAFSASASGGNIAGPGLTSKKDLASYAIGDTLGFFGDSVLLTLGVRRQEVDTKSFAYNTGAQTAAYKSSRTSPAAGIVFKARSDLSLYANYIEALSPGVTAPALSGGLPVLNVGQTLAPYVARQTEIGAKYDGGNIGAGIAAFSITKPRVLRNAAGYYGAEGEDQHRGVELNLFGQATRGLRLLGGVTFLDAQQKSTGSAATSGKDVIGVPRVQASANVEWDVPAIAGFTGLSGLTLNARVTSQGKSYANADNTLSVPSWTRLDIGARYVTEFQGRLVTLRGRIDNVGNKNYWASAGGSADAGYLVLGAPRTVSLTASVDF